MSPMNLKEIFSKNTKEKFLELIQITIKIYLNNGNTFGNGQFLTSHGHIDVYQTFSYVPQCVIVQKYS